MAMATGPNLYWVVQELNISSTFFERSLGRIVSGAGHTAL